MLLIGLAGCVARVDSRFVRLRAEGAAPGSIYGVAVYPRLSGDAVGTDLPGRFGPAWRAVRVHPGHNFN